MSRDKSRRSDDLEDDFEDGSTCRETSWTAVGRYLTAKRAEDMKGALEEASIRTRVGLEGRSSHELIRVRVPVDQLDDAEFALFDSLKHIAPEMPDLGRYTGLAGKMRRRKELARLTSELEAALAGNDGDLVIEILWKAVALDPDDPHKRRQLVGALLDRDSRGDTLLARWWVEHAMRRHGVAAMAAEMASIAICENSLDEAEAWLDEAAKSGADPVEVAFERCNLAFAKGVLRELKQAASDFRRSCDIPDCNWVEVAAMLAAAGEVDRAGQMLGTALRDSPLLAEDEWALAAALRMVAEGADDQSRDELIELVGEDDAEELEEEAAGWLRGLKKDWKRALDSSKKSKRLQRYQKGGKHDNSKRGQS